MSVDTYFCICCMSTDDISCLCSENSDISYADLLRRFFRIKISLEDFGENGHICKMCAQTLEDIQKFRTQVLRVLSILEGNGLIQMCNEEKYLHISKNTKDNFMEIDEKFDIEQKDILIPENSNKQPKEEFQLTFDIEQPTTDTKKRQKKSLTDKEDLITNKYEVKGDLTCTVCDDVLPNVYTYHTHMNAHYPNHICETCGKGFTTESRLKRHMTSHKNGPFKCQECKEEFRNYNTYHSHKQRKHSSLVLYSCPLCNERFSTFSRRATHLAVSHHQTAKYTCQICQKRFLTAGNLSTHTRIKHKTGVKHACADCGATFAQRRELAAHDATHKGGGAYSCTMCNKRYPRKKALTVHMRTHTNERRFGCEVCGKRFIQKCTLSAHLKTHYNAELTAAEATEILDLQNVEYFVK